MQQIEIHFLENNGHIKLIASDEPAKFESGYWSTIGFAKARCLAKAKAWILFHSSQESAAEDGAKSGGRITGFRVHKGPEYPEFVNRIVFLYDELNEAKGKKTAKEGWQRTQKIVGYKPCKS